MKLNVIEDLRRGLSEVLVKKAKAEAEAREISQKYPEYLTEALDSIGVLDQEIWEFKKEIERLSQPKVKVKRKAVVVETGTERDSWIEAVKAYKGLQEAENLREQKLIAAAEAEEKRLQELVRKTLGQEIKPRVYKPVNTKTQDTESWEEKQVRWSARKALAAFGRNIS